MVLSAQTSKYSDYKNLIVYQKALSNTITLFGYYKDKKLTWAEQIIIRQLLRALSSIGANIVEGYGRHTTKEYFRFLKIAKGSSLESEYWIDLLIQIRPKDKEILSKAREVNIEVIKILTAILRKK